MQIKKLIKVSGDVNNNKYYEMLPQTDGTFLAKWGRIEGGKGESQSYPISSFEKKYKEKLRKGYKDVTEIVAISTSSNTFADIKDKSVASFVNTLQSYSNTSIKNNYTVSANSVTQKQVDEAQRILNSLIAVKKVNEANEKLEELFTVIPRKMKKVSDHLISKDVNNNPKEFKDEINQIITEEQATLDVMAGQVSANIKTKDHSSSDSLLEALGLEISTVNDTKVLNEVKKLLGDDKDKFKNVYKVINKNTQTKFDKYFNEHKHKEKQLFWHGSRNENWLSVISNGLVLKPTNAVITGKMFGMGLYFADKARKSIGYTSLSGSYWASGRANSAYLGLFDVHIGNTLKVQRHDHYMSYLDYKGLKAKGDYDSLSAIGGFDLRNNEFIIYQENQCTVSYIVEIGN